jgi:hypothetical protein
MKLINRIHIILAILLISLNANSQNTQTVRGQILDEASKAPLPGVSISIISSQPFLGTVSDVNGNFKINNVPIGRQSIKISFIGYEEQVTSNVIVTSGKEIVLNIVMTEKVNKLSGVDVVYDRSQDSKETLNEMTSVSARSFNLEDTKKYAGALGDPSRMAANFAGVIGANDSRNDIVVRGNSPNGMLWQMEGLNIPNPNHFGSFTSTGGPVSMLNNNNLDKSDFMTSAFPAQYGNATAGVFDLHLRNGNNEKTEFVGQVGFNGFELGAEGPFSKKTKGSYIVNYRYSTLGVFQQLGINFGTGSATPLYQDLNYKIFLPSGSKGKFTLFGMYGRSSVEFLGKDVDTTETDLYGSENENSKVKFANTITGLAYDHQLSKKTNIRFNAGVGTTFQDFKGDSISYLTREEFPSAQATFETIKYSTGITLTHKFNAKNSLMAGVTSDLNHFELFNKDIYNGTTDRVLVDIQDEYVLLQSYVQWKHRFNNKLSLNTGLHSQYLDLNESFAIEPRVGLKYLINDFQSIGIGYGLHSQMQNIYTYYVQTPTANGIEYTNQDLDFTRSHHLVLSYDCSLSEFVRIKTEIYYQSIFDAPVERIPSSFSALNTGADFGPSNQDSLINDGTGTNYGLELTLERFFSRNYYFLITASLFDSKYKGSDGVERNTAFNTNYVFNVLGGKEFAVGKKGNIIALNVKVTYTGGKYLTPIDYAASAIEKDAVFKESEAYSERQDPYFRTDIKVSYRKEYRRSTMEFALDLQNVTNNKNVFMQSYNPRTNSISTEYQQGFFPVPTFRYTF